MSSTALRDEYDVVIVGAGPAGLAAAQVCGRAGLATAVLDEQASAGGQIYRAIETTPLPRGRVLGPDYWRGASLLEGMRSSGAQLIANTTVWSLNRERELGISQAGGVRMLRARRVILCTGALERPFPIPGWTLPGVMTVGAAQILLKTAALVPQGPVVLAGCGPLLWLLAWQYLQAGLVIDTILDTTPRENRSRSLRHAASFLRSPYALKGLRLMFAVRSRVRVIANVTELRATGDGRVREIAYRADAGPESRRAVACLLLHQGVVPNVNLPMAAGVEHHWDDEQLCFVPKIDADGGTSLDGVAIAGDGAGIGGAEVAAQRGVLAGIAAVRALKADALTTDRGRVLGVLARYGRGRAFLDAWYRPAKTFRIPSGDTLVCRCEEVSASQIEEVVKLGCPGPNQMKAFLRCGMGPCQGRLCGLTVTELIAEQRGISPQQVGYYRLRPPVKPITVAEMASLPRTEADVKAVARY